MRTYLRLLPFLRPYRRDLVCTWLLTGVLLLLQVLVVWIGAEFVARILTDQGTPTASLPAVARFFDWFAELALDADSEYGSIVRGAVCLALFGVLGALLRLAKLFLAVRACQSMLVDMRRAMFDRLVAMDLAFSRRIRPGEITSVFQHDVDQLVMATWSMIDRIVTQPMRLLLSLVLMLAVSAWFTMWVLLALAICGVILHFATRHTVGVSQRRLKAVAGLQGHLGEYLSTAMLSRALNREPTERAAFTRTCEELRASSLRLHVATALAPDIVRSVAILAGSALLVTGGHAVLVRGTMDAGDLLKCLALVPLTALPMQALASLHVSMRINVACAQRVFGFLDEPIPERDDDGPVEAPRLQAAIEFRDVSFHRGDRPILSDVSFTIPCGRTVVLRGASGAGKTTLLRLLARIETQYQGAILVDGVDVRTLRRASWREQLGIVTQEPLFLNGTVRSNLAYARPDASESAMRAALEQVGLGGADSSLTDGLDTEVHNRGDAISGGERQRLAIARALLCERDVLLLDEPTAMLDQGSRDAVIATIAAVASGRTVVMSTHDEQLCRIADQVFEIDAGRLRERVREGA